MAMDKSKLKYTMHGDMDYVLIENGNTFTAMRMVSWKEGADPKLDIRNYYIDKEGNEVPSKGITFNTESDGPNCLVNALINEGYGDTEDIINGIKNREDFMPSLVKCLNEEEIKETNIDPSTVVNEYYDPTASFFEEE